MDASFLLLSTYFIANQCITAYSHRCIHDSLSKPPMVQSYVGYGMTSDHRRTLLPDVPNIQTQINDYKPIRIQPYWKSIESSSQKQINYVKHLVSAAITYFESFINVIPATGRLYYPRTCDVAQSVSYFGPTRYYRNCKVYAQVSKCGASQIPSSHFRNDWKYYTGGAINTSLYPAGDGVADSDLVLYVSMDSLFCESDVRAWAIPCVSDQNGRPIFGTINVCPRNPNVWQKDIMTAIHELTHVLGFTSALYPHYRQSVVVALNSTNQWIITPTVQSVARTYFNCTDIIGAPLENNEASASHWEEYFLNGEYMTQYNNNKQSYVSLFTLALLQDTGWYNVDFNYASPQFQWGYHKGCSFFEQRCFDKGRESSNYPQYFCNPNVKRNDYCTADHMSLGYCIGSTKHVPASDKYQYFRGNASYGYETSEYCPYVDSLNYTQCIDLNASSALNSRCVDTGWSAVCASVTCNQYNHVLKQWNSLDVMIDNSSIRCFRNDTLKEKSNILCPAIDTICVHRRPFTCNHGAWNDELDECICSAGYTGASCQMELKIVVSAVQQYNGTHPANGPYENDVCGILLMGRHAQEIALTGTWYYQGYDESNKSVYPYYSRDDYYLYFDTHFHTWNIGKHLNDRYTESTVLAICDIGERPVDVMDCSHYFYFSDSLHYLWTQDIYFIVLHGTCENQSASMAKYVFNASHWISDTFHMNTPYGLRTTMMDEVHKNTNNNEYQPTQTPIPTIVILMTVAVVCVVFAICIGVYIYRTMHRKKLDTQLMFVKQEMDDE